MFRGIVVNSFHTKIKSVTRVEDVLFLIPRHEDDPSQVVLTHHYFIMIKQYLYLY